MNSGFKEVLAEIVKDAMREAGQFEGLSQKIENLDKKLDTFQEEMDYKLDIVFDELYTIRTALEEKHSA